VDPVPDPLLRKFGSAGNRTRTSGSVARNPNHYTTEAVVPDIYLSLINTAVRNVYSKKTAIITSRILRYGYGNATLQYAAYDEKGL
jgi:hypothetical protein